MDNTENNKNAEQAKAEKKAALEAFRKERKAMKKRAHQTVRTHYAFLFLVCLIMMIVGVEFSQSLDFMGLGSGESETKGSGTVSNSKATDVLYDIQEEGLRKGDKEAKKHIKEYRKNTKKGAVLGRRNGVLATVVNNVTSGGFYVQIISALRHAFKSTKIATTVFILLALLLSLLFFVFVQNTMKVVGRRLFLEAREYERVPAHHLLWLKSVHRWVKASLGVLLESVFLSLWSLTIVGLPIKYYAYYLVSFIIAENPDIEPMEAIRLSSRMMYGHKWERFKVDMTLIGWRLLGGLTLGAADLFYGNQYLLSVDSEYYAYIRGLSKENKVEGADLLNDKYLFEHASEEELWKKYMDVDSESKYVEDNRITLTGVRKFFVENFGLWIGPSDEKKKYQEIEGRAFAIRREKDVLEGRAYPERMHKLADPKFATLAGKVSFLRCYTIWSVVLLFFTFAVAGWLWEVALHLVNDGTFVNRGMLHGPWLPIYGYGGTLILVLLTRFRKNPMLELVLGMVLAGIVEFATSWVLEMTKGMKWWDYSGYFLNIQGRICAEGLVIFGIGGLLVVYALAPFLDNLIEKMPGRSAMALSLVLLAVFGADQIYSNKHPNVGEGITAGPVKKQASADVGRGLGRLSYAPPSGRTIRYGSNGIIRI